jgi:hypothetical protein
VTLTVAVIADDDDESGKVGNHRVIACDDMNCTCIILIQTILYTVLVDQTD